MKLAIRRSSKFRSYKTVIRKDKTQKGNIKIKKDKYNKTPQKRERNRKIL